MKRMVDIEVDLSADEIIEFSDMCSESGVCPAQKLGELIHGFLVAEGVKHRCMSEGRKSRR